MTQQLPKQFAHLVNTGSAMAVCDSRFVAAKQLKAGSENINVHP